MVIVPSLTSSWIQCHQMSICLECLWNWGLRTIAIDPSLSPRISVGISSCKRPSSVYKFRNQHASRDASKSVTYSTLVDKSTVETCFFKLQVMAPSLARKMLSQVKPVLPHLKRGLYKKPPSPPNLTLKPSYSQIVKMKIFPCDPEKQAHDPGKLLCDQSYAPPVLSKPHDLSHDLTDD